MDTFRLTVTGRRQLAGGVLSSSKARQLVVVAAPHGQPRLNAKARAARLSSLTLLNSGEIVAPRMPWQSRWQCESGAGGLPFIRLMRWLGWAHTRSCEIRTPTQRHLRRDVGPESARVSQSPKPAKSGGIVTTLECAQSTSREIIDPRRPGQDRPAIAFFPPCWAEWAVLVLPQRPRGCDPRALLTELTALCSFAFRFTNESFRVSADFIRNSILSADDVYPTWKAFIGSSPNHRVRA